MTFRVMKTTGTADEMSISIDLEYRFLKLCEKRKIEVTYSPRAVKKV